MPPTVSPCAARPAAAAPLRRLLAPGRLRLPGLHELVATARRAALRPLRRARRLAGCALPRVLGPADRVRLRPGRGRVRRGCPHARLRLEGARAAPPRLARRRARGRGRATAIRTTDHVRAARRRAEPRARRPPARAPRPRARPALGATGRAGARRARGRCGASAASPARSGGGTSAAPSARSRCAGASSSSTTCTRRARRCPLRRRALRAAGAASVEVVTFARAVRR